MEEKHDYFGLKQIFIEHKGKGKQIRMLSVNELIKKYKGAALRAGVVFKTKKDKYAERRYFVKES